MIRFEVLALQLFLLEGVLVMPMASQVLLRLFELMLCLGLLGSSGLFGVIAFYVSRAEGVCKENTYRRALFNLRQNPPLLLLLLLNSLLQVFKKLHILL